MAPCSFAKQTGSGSVVASTRAMMREELHRVQHAAADGDFEWRHHVLAGANETGPYRVYAASVQRYGSDGASQGSPVGGSTFTSWPAGGSQTPSRESIDGTGYSSNPKL